MTGDPTDNPLDALRRTVDDDAVMDARIADRLEADLRIAHADLAGRPPLWRRAQILVPAALLVVALSVGLALRDETPTAALVVSGAENVTIVLPDGRELMDPEDGFVLPDGAIVEVGAGGQVTIDDVVIDDAAAGSPVVLAVRDGRLITDVVATTTTPDRPDHLDPAPTTTEAPVDVTTTTTSEAPPTTTTPPPASTTTVARPTDDTRDDRPDDRPDDREDRPTDDGRDGGRDGDGRRDDRGDDDEPTETAPEDGPTLALALELRRIDAGASVSWQVEGLEPGWTVVVYRAIGDRPPEPIVTTADASGSIEDTPTREDGRPVDRRIRYRLVVLDEGGGEVASGPVQSLR